MLYWKLKRKAILDSDGQPFSLGVNVTVWPTSIVKLIEDPGEPKPY
jgi:hypothetical protein